MWGWLIGDKRDNDPAPASESLSITTIRAAVSTISDLDIVGDETELAATAAATLALQVAEAAVGEIDNDDKRFMAGLCDLVFSCHLSHLAGGDFEKAASLAVLETLGPDQAKRTFQAILNSHTDMVQRQDRFERALGNSCSLWVNHPSSDAFVVLVKAFNIGMANMSPIGQR